MFTFSSEDGRTLRDFLPTFQTVCVLVTSRNQAAVNNLVETHPMFLVKTMGIEHAIRLLKTRITIEEDSKEAAKELVKTLDFLPLAVSHAGSFIRSRKPTMSIKRYLDLFNNELTQARILNNSDIVDVRRDAGSARTVIATWQISFEVIRKDHRTAANILALMSMYDNQNIPKSLLQHELANKVDTKQLEKRLEEVYHDLNMCAEREHADQLQEFEFEEDLALLLGYSLITIEADSSSIKLHRLVQLSVKQWLQQKAELDIWQTVSMLILFQHFPNKTSYDSTICQQLLPHARKVLEFPVDKKWTLPKAILMRQMVRYLDNIAQYKDAYRILQNAAAICEEHLGVSYEMTLNLTAEASSYYLLCPPIEERIKELEQLVLSYQKINVEKHYSLLAQELLGELLRQSGKISEATDTLQHCLHRRNILLGHADSNTVACAFRSIDVLIDQGNYSAGIQFLRVLLKQTIKHHGISHLTVIDVKQKLAESLTYRGQYLEAGSMFEAMLSDMEESLVSYDGRIVACQFGLADSLFHQGRAEEAKNLSETAFTNGRLSLSDEDPLILSTATMICLILIRKEKFAEVDSFCRDMMAELQRPTQLLSKIRLFSAISALRQDSAEKAEDAFRRLGRELRAQLGDKHPESLECALWLCRTLDEQKQVTELAQLRRQTYDTIQTTDFSPSSHQLRKVAFIFWQFEAYGEAEILHRKIVTEGKHHARNRETLSADLHNLCMTLEKQNKWIEAESCRKENLQLIESIHDSESVMVLDVLCKLGECLYNQSRYSEAEEVFRKRVNAERSAKHGGTRLFDSILYLRDTLVAQDKWAEVEELREQLSDAEE